MTDTQTAQTATPADRLPCPECGQACKGAVGLGRHRAIKHGVPGQSKGATGRRRRAERQRATGKARHPLLDALGETRQLVDDVLAEFAAMMSMIGEVRGWNKTLRKALIRSRAESLRMTQQRTASEDKE